MAKLFANSGDPDQTPRSAASDLGLHCLPVTFLRVSRLQWVNVRTTLVMASSSIGSYSHNYQRNMSHSSGEHDMHRR